ncbi:hypothetical protein C8Q76DRAFT_589110, partial [Earliella scabrosa]
AVISGSVALQFFLDDATWAPRDMDIYVPDHKWNEFIRALKRLGFRSALQDTFDFTPSGHVAINGIKELRRFSSPTGRAVDVIRSYFRNPLPPLYYFWSTLLVNFIGPGGCVCAYPALTLQRRGVLKA